MGPIALAICLLTNSVRLSSNSPSCSMPSKRMRPRKAGSPPRDRAPEPDGPSGALGVRAQGGFDGRKRRQEIADEHELGMARQGDGGGRRRAAFAQGLGQSLERARLAEGRSSPPRRAIRSRRAAAGGQRQDQQIGASAFRGSEARSANSWMHWHRARARRSGRRPFGIRAVEPTRIWPIGANRCASSDRPAVIEELPEGIPDPTRLRPCTPVRRCGNAQGGD